MRVTHIYSQFDCRMRISLEHSNALEISSGHRMTYYYPPFAKNPRVQKKSTQTGKSLSAAAAKKRRKKNANDPQTWRARVYAH